MKKTSVQKRKNHNLTEGFREMLLLVLLFLLGSAIAFSQDLTISGRVIEESGESLPGVAVAVKGTVTGTVTDLDSGGFTIKAPNGSTLVFSFVGMETQEVLVTGGSTIDVTMKTSTVGLDGIGSDWVWDPVKGYHNYLNH